MEKEYLGLKRLGAENTGDGGGGGQAVLGRRGSALVTKCCNLPTYIIHEGQSPVIWKKKSISSDLEENQVDLQ